jgi:hypothetical protein
MFLNLVFLRSYQFSVIDRYVYDDATLSLWNSKKIEVNFKIRDDRFKAYCSSLGIPYSRSCPQNLLSPQRTWRIKKSCSTHTKDPIKTLHDEISHVGDNIMSEIVDFDNIEDIRL